MYTNICTCICICVCVRKCTCIGIRIYICKGPGKLVITSPQSALVITVNCSVRLGQNWQHLLILLVTLCLYHISARVGKSSCFLVVPCCLYYKIPLDPYLITEATAISGSECVEMVFLGDL